MASTTRIQKIVTKCKVNAQKSDFTFWQTQSYQARLDALEDIRREYHGWKYGADPGFQRVYCIVKRQ